MSEHRVSLAMFKRTSCLTDSLQSWAIRPAKQYGCIRQSNSKAAAFAAELQDSMDKRLDASMAWLAGLWGLEDLTSGGSEASRPGNAPKGSPPMIGRSIFDSGGGVRTSCGGLWQPFASIGNGLLPHI